MCKQTKHRPFCDGSHRAPEIQEARLDGKPDLWDPTADPSIEQKANYLRSASMQSEEVDYLKLADEEEDEEGEGGVEGADAAETEEPQTTKSKK